MMTTILILLAIVIAAFVAFQYAVSRNGPAVVDWVNWATRDGSDSHLAAEAVQFGGDPAQRLHVFVPGQESEDAPVLVFLHGGSWRWGNPDDYGFIGRSFAGDGIVTVVAGYRLVPGGEYPAMLEDGAATLAWVRENIADYGGDPDRVILMGHSAGAYNAAMLALEQRWLDSAGVPPESIRGVVGLAGPYDFYPFDGEATQNAFGGAADPEATQPINQVGGNAPPFLLVHGDADTTVRPRNSRVLAKAIEQAGGDARVIEQPGGDHNAPLLRMVSPWSRNDEARDQVVQFIKEKSS